MKVGWLGGTHKHQAGDVYRQHTSAYVVHRHALPCNGCQGGCITKNLTTPFTPRAVNLQH